MHSRIFQVKTKPIDGQDYIRESDYYDHWFTHQIADYVNEDTDRDYDIKWLSECAKGYEVGEDDNGEYLIVNSKEEYFASAYARFNHLLAQIGKPTMADFIDVNGIDMWRVNNAYEDKFGFYIDNYDCQYGSELMTLDAFIRRCDVGVKYYIGNTIDYHC